MIPIYNPFRFSQADKEKCHHVKVYVSTNKCAY